MIHQVQKNLDAVLNRWFPLSPEKLGVAVSGGVDSLALAFGVYAWAQKNHPCKVVPIIVNHRLHPGETAESQYIASVLKEWGMEPLVLPWEHTLITTGVLEKARQGKYETLAMGCHSQGIAHLCLGHHQDDMLETVWMRKKNHAPQHALSGMSAVTMRYGIHILRPFLHTEKHALKDWMMQCGVRWVQDPMNTDPRYDRTVARQSIKKWTPDERKAAWSTLCAVGHARCLHETMLRGLTRSIHGLGYVRVLNFLVLMALPVLDGCLWIQSWVHSFSFGPISGLMGQARLWLTLCRAFSEKTGSNRKIMDGKIIATFAGCIFVRCQNELWIFREYARIDPEPVSSLSHLWDDRVFSQDPIQFQRAEYTKKGAWKDRFVRTCLPKNWDPENMTYRACNMPYPHFRTLDSGDFFAAELGQNQHFGV